MISWIVASHDRKILHANLLRHLFPEPGEEVLTEWDAPSIAVAYNRATTRASNPIRVYVHHDVRLLAVARLRQLLPEVCTQERGMVGVIGSTQPAWPWWDAPEKCGSALDTLLGPLRFSYGGQPAAILDGCFLATRQQITWDESFTGFHGYDHDVCMAQLDAGRENWCLPGGESLVLHNRVSPTSPTDVRLIPGFDEAGIRIVKKWGAHLASATAYHPLLP